MGNLLEDYVPDDQPDDLGKCALYDYRRVYEQIKRRYVVYRNGIYQEPRAFYGDVLDLLPDRYPDYSSVLRYLLGIRLLSET